MQTKKGFTLIELMAALFAATVLCFSSMRFYCLYHKLVYCSTQKSRQESFQLLLRLKNVDVGKRKIPGLRTED